MSSSLSSRRFVIAALCGNSFVGLIKFVAFYLSGSDAMLSEAIHSVADTGNQMLLLIGLSRSMRRSDDDFQYGYGGERFVFGLLSAAGIFFLGCGVTIYHGASSLVHPSRPDLGRTTFAVLAVSAVIEGSVLYYAIHGLRKERGELSLWRHLRERADPATLAIVLEDGAAVLGLLLATVGILLAYATGFPIWDSLASIAVGILLGLIALHLVAENRALLLGQSVPEEVAERFASILRAWPGVKGVRDVKTRQLTPEAYVLKAEITFDERILLKTLDELVPKDGAISGPSREAMLRSIAARVIHQIAVEIDGMEHAVRAAIPQARHIDLEVDRTIQGGDPPSRG
jgi:solute carrier family 30 (zinc transporter), member 9